MWRYLLTIMATVGIDATIHRWYALDRDLPHVMAFTGETLHLHRAFGCWELTDVGSGETLTWVNLSDTLRAIGNKGVVGTAIGIDPQMGVALYHGSWGPVDESIFVSLGNGFAGMEGYLLPQYDRMTGRMTTWTDMIVLDADGTPAPTPVMNVTGRRMPCEVITS